MLWGLKSLTCWGDLKKKKKKTWCESNLFHWIVSFRLAFPFPVLLFHHVCLVLTPLHPLSGWGQNLLHFMVWNKILLRKCCILKSFPPSILTFQGECRRKKQVWGVIWYVLRDCAFVCDTTAGVFFKTVFAFKGSTRFTRTEDKLSPLPWAFLFWHQDEALSSACTRNTAKFAN